MADSSSRSIPALAKALTTHKLFEAFILSIIVLAGVVVGLGQLQKSLDQMRDTLSRQSQS